MREFPMAKDEKTSGLDNFITQLLKKWMSKRKCGSGRPI